MQSVSIVTWAISSIDLVPDVPDHRDVLRGWIVIRALVDTVVPGTVPRGRVAKVGNRRSVQDVTVELMIWRNRWSWVVNLKENIDF